MCPSSATAFVRQFTRTDLLTLGDPTIAWTGGESPPLYANMPDCTRFLVRFTFRRQVVHHASYWGRCDLRAARILWHRAKADAYATMHPKGL